MFGNHFFKVYSAASLIVPIWIVAVAISEHKTTFSTLVDLTSFKLNLLIFFNGVMVLFILFSNFLTWIFFGDIRIIEQKVSSFSHLTPFCIVRHGQITEKDLPIPPALDRIAQHI